MSIHRSLIVLVFLAIACTLIYKAQNRINREHQVLKSVTQKAAIDAKVKKDRALEYLKESSKIKTSFVQYYQSALEDDQLLNSIHQNPSKRFGSDTSRLGRKFNIDESISSSKDSNLYKIVSNYASRQFYVDLADSINNSIFEQEVYDIALLSRATSYRVGESYNLQFASYFEVVNRSFRYEYDSGEGIKAIDSIPLVFDTIPDRLNVFRTPLDDRFIYSGKKSFMIFP